jgi:hypothetical protein
MLFGFGATALNDGECARLSIILHKMRFAMLKPRSERLTADQADAIRAMAHKMKRPSIALAQAFQFDCKLSQKDVIGEWVPIDESGTSEVISATAKWLHGLRWCEIENFILRHTTSRGKNVEFDLRRAPMVKEELAKLGELKTSRDPIIIYELTGLPYEDHNFRRVWRSVANAAGVPKNVKNRDSRALTDQEPAAQRGRESVG